MGYYEGSLPGSATPRMVTSVLGISGLYHDSAAALVVDGEIVSAAEEERFSRRKHDFSFPIEAIRYCLGQKPAGTKLNAAVFYEDEVLSFDRVLATILGTAPSSRAIWPDAVRSMLGGKAQIETAIRNAVDDDVPILYVKHHLAHAASAFYPSPFDHAAILVVDGVGEWATTTIGVGQGTDISLLREIRFPHSLGLLYSAFTEFCGFKTNSGEYKLMGLAPYGEPRYASLIRERLIDVKSDGSFRLNMEFFSFHTSRRATNSRFEQLFGGSPRLPETPLSRREADLAASIQSVVEEVMLLLAAEVRRATGASALCMAGGVALNCVANGKIARSGLFPDGIWVQPAASDAGGALGAALLAGHGHFGLPRPPVGHKSDRQKGSFLGPRFSHTEVRRCLDRLGAAYRHLPDQEARSRLIAEALDKGKIVGLFQGAMEFGPRALGARSILADPRNPETQVALNRKIKFRESWRPFAAAILEERAKEYFNLDDASPYMLIVAPLVETRRASYQPTWPEDGDLLRQVRRIRSDVPAVTHVDFSTRLQTVNRLNNQEFYSILSAFDALTGCPLLVNTSFNVRGEPIVCNPMDAFACFMNTDIDLLVIEDFLLWKAEQPADLFVIRTGQPHALD